MSDSTTEVFPLWWAARAISFCEAYAPLIKALIKEKVPVAIRNFRYGRLSLTFSVQSLA
jgi:hypothetical protein